MIRFNLNSRILMFAICSSIEYDLRQYLITNPVSVSLPDELYKKAVKRNDNIRNFCNASSIEEILIEL
ncbi:hypothetical protein PKB67_002198, partial [Enterococcus faecalis]|nr:hypothetical protein [Enterococcus faecalis]